MVFFIYLVRLVLKPFRATSVDKLRTLKFFAINTPYHCRTWPSEHCVVPWHAGFTRIHHLYPKMPRLQRFSFCSIDPTAKHKHIHDECTDTMITHTFLNSIAAPRTFLLLKGKNYNTRCWATVTKLAPNEGQFAC